MPLVYDDVGVAPFTYLGVIVLPSTCTTFGTNPEAPTLTNKTRVTDWPVFITEFNVVELLPRMLNVKSVVALLVKY